MRRKWLRLLGVLAALTMVVGACGSDRGDDPAAGQDADSDAPAEGEGDGDGGAVADGFGTLESPCGEAGEVRSRARPAIRG